MCWVQFSCPLHCTIESFSCTMLTANQQVNKYQHHKVDDDPSHTCLRGYWCWMSFWYVFTTHWKDKEYPSNHCECDDPACLVSICHWFHCVPSFGSSSTVEQCCCMMVDTHQPPSGTIQGDQSEPVALNRSSPAFKLVSASSNGSCVHIFICVQIGAYLLRFGL